MVSVERYVSPYQGCCYPSIHLHARIERHHESASVFPRNIPNAINPARAVKLRLLVCLDMECNIKMHVHCIRPNVQCVLQSTILNNSF